MFVNSSNLFNQCMWCKAKSIVGTLILIPVIKNSFSYPSSVYCAIKILPHVLSYCPIHVSKIMHCRSNGTKMGSNQLRFCLHPPPEVEGRKKAPSLKNSTTRNPNTISAKSSVHKEATTVAVSTGNHMLCKSPRHI